MLNHECTGRVDTENTGTNSREPGHDVDVQLWGNTMILGRQHSRLEAATQAAQYWCDNRAKMLIYIHCPCHTPASLTFDQPRQYFLTERPALYQLFSQKRS